jgi:N-sulfoglucosamine sulfohydrolase
MIRTVAIALLLITLSVVSAFNFQKTKQKPEPKPNILWITCEDMSPYIGAYGDKIVKTPNIDQLAKEGVRYQRAYTTAGVCAPSRSSIITGMYPVSIGTQHMRTQPMVPKFAGSGVPNYAAVIPEYVKAFPEYLRMNGYYTTNNEKTDYQFDAPVTVWDDNGPSASYANRPAEQPFFSIFNLFITHESQLFSRKDSLLVSPDDVEVPPIYKDTKIVRKDIARLLTNIQRMDQQVGEIIAQLKADGLYDNTYIFFYSDHGGSLPWTKREVLERGTHIPLIIKYPQGKNAGTTNTELISAVDFAPSILSLAGIKIPEYLQGQAFLESQKAKTPRKYVFAARDRMDELYDRVRSVRDQQFRYVLNYMPEQPSYQDVNYRKSIPMMQEMLELHEQGKLDPDQEVWFKTPKAMEELYDVTKDPYELRNLAANPAYATKLKELKRALTDWKNKVGDLSSIPEKDMVYGWWNGKDKAPETEKPIISPSASGLKITCTTKGASIGYRIIKSGEAENSELTSAVHTYDSGTVSGKLKEGEIKPVKSVWEVYTGKHIVLKKGEKILVQAMRIGYQPANSIYTQE